MTDLLIGIAATSSLAAVVMLIVLLVKRSHIDTESIGAPLREEIRLSRSDASTASKELRSEVSAQLTSSTETLVKTVGELGKTQGDRLEAITKSVEGLTNSNEQRLEKVRETLDQRIRTLQENNEKKLDEMRQTVDEKLQSTLEKRLTESFKVVSENLEAVQRGLGEMQNLATGVGDLKRVLTNVKSRGTWGEVQLGALLEDILTPEQFDKNVHIKEGTGEVVEFAVRLPGKGFEDPDSCVFLPIDSKFPQEDYQRLVDASELADADGEKAASAALLRTLHSSAKDIHDKYILPPKTTDFAVMFLPTEGLYSEVLRKPGQVEELQRKFRVVVAGPTTLSALLMSLRMGFRTLAIEKQSSEVWRVLGAVKSEFGVFETFLAKIKRQLDLASKTLEDSGKRTRAMERKLRSVEQLPSEEAVALLGMGELEQELDVDLGEETDSDDPFADVDSA
ncbi:DNA recombination protein RmuC [Candidatus Bipolaricaulota bacterium]